jgi:hypothetical protein
MPELTFSARKRRRSSQLRFDLQPVGPKAQFEPTVPPVSKNSSRQLVYRETQIKPSGSIIDKVGDVWERYDVYDVYGMYGPEKVKRSAQH